MKAVFLEYAWDLGFCDPCSAQPLSGDELRELGAAWITGGPSYGGGQPAFVTRLRPRRTRLMPSGSSRCFWNAAIGVASPYSLATMRPSR